MEVRSLGADECRGGWLEEGFVAKILADVQAQPGMHAVLLGAGEIAVGGEINLM